MKGKITSDQCAHVDNKLLTLPLYPLNSQVELELATDSNKHCHLI